jgi:hypothetical protein
MATAVQQPALSLVVALHESSRQGQNALYSISTAYQRNVTEPYEIVVAEALSDDVLGEERARAFGDNVRYVDVPLGPAWRARSIAAGLELARASAVGVFHDGAHIVTPRVVELALEAFRSFEWPLVVVADYVLDAERVAARGDVDAELEWFAQSGWKDSPYALFESAVYGPACPNGPLSPITGPSVLFFHKQRLRGTGALERARDVPGSGAFRLQFYTQLSRLAGTRLVALVGEGAFRQTHSEVATEWVRHQEGSVERLMVDAVLPQGSGFEPVHREPVSFGDLGVEAERHVTQSATLAEYHCAVCRHKGEPSWYTDRT